MQTHELVIALTQGVVEGLTEFLPVSSTGHLIIVGHYLDFEGALANTFDIVIQAGAILAVLILFFKRYLRLLDFSDPTAGFSGKHGIGKLLVACLPAFVLGPLVHGAIKRYLFNPTWVSIALVLGAIVMLIVEARRPAVKTHVLEEISYKQAFLIGVAQCLAMWPGISRSGATIVAGMCLGLERYVAAQFSFLVAAPVLLAATAYELLKSMHALSAHDLPLFAVGFVVSFVSGLAAVKGFMHLISTWTLKSFAYYRIVLGILVLALLK